MKRLLLMLLLVLGYSAVASARDSVKGWCEEGNRPVVTSGLNSTTRVQASHPSCVVTIYVHGGGLATIYSDNNGTPLANPFTGRSNGQWQAYAANGRYDVTMTSAGFSQPITYSDILLCDPLDANASCGVSTSGINLSINSGSASSVTLVNLIGGTNVTLTQSGSDVTINSSGGGGGAVPCTTSVAGTWDIVPQTCAGEKVLQGIAGNPTVQNLVLTPASDQTAINSFFGDAASNFSAITTLQVDTPLTDSFHTATSYNRSNAAAPYFSALLGYNESHNTTVGGGNPVFGVRCVGVESGTRITTTVQACEGEGFNNGTQASGNAVNVLDAFSGFVSSGPNAETFLQADFYASRNVGTSGSTRTRGNFGFYTERQEGIGLNNYSIWAQGPLTFGSFFVNADTGHVNIGVLDSAQLKGLCYNTGAIDTSATFVVSTCLQDTPTAFASIGTCNAGNEGALATVNNSNTNTHAATVAGGGANHVLAYCDGSNWKVAYP